MTRPVLRSQLNIRLGRQDFLPAENPYLHPRSSPEWVEEVPDHAIRGESRAVVQECAMLSAQKISSGNSDAQ